MDLRSCHYGIKSLNTMRWTTDFEVADETVFSSNFTETNSCWKIMFIKNICNFCNFKRKEKIDRKELAANLQLIFVNIMIHIK